MSGYEGWAIVELMGRKRLAGRVSEVTFAGTQMVRLDVPAAEGDGFDPPQLIGGSSLYRVSFVDEAKARQEAEMMRPGEVRQLPPAMWSNRDAWDEIDDEEEDEPEDGEEDGSVPGDPDITF